MGEVAVAEFDDKQVQEFLAEMAKKLRYVKDGSKEYAGLLSATVFQDIMEHFSREEGSTGPWQNWSKSYMDAIAGLYYYRRIGGKTVKISTEGMKNPPKPPRKPGKKLQATGRLRNSFKPRNYRSTSAGILWYNNAVTKDGFPYAFAHNEGGDKLPKRDFMWLSDPAMEKISLETLFFMLEKGI